MAKFTITLEGDEPQEKEQLLEFAHSLSDQEKKSFLNFLNGIQFAMQSMRKRKRHYTKSIKIRGKLHKRQKVELYNS